MAYQGRGRSTLPQVVDEWVADWSYTPRPERKPTVEEMCPGVSHCLVSEQIGCELGLVFALLNWPRDFEWYRLTTTEASKHPTGSWANCHWWGLRYLWSKMEGNLEEFREYRAWKYEQLEWHRIQRNVAPATRK